MTRFNSRLERRVESDLTQISDQATPSSTAWEAIRHRIDEQDTEPTMEVIMLDPDTNKLHKRPRTGLLVAACLAAVALIGGLIVVANRDDDTPPADRPDPTVPATDPAIVGDPEPVVEPEPAQPVETDTQGLFSSRCTFDSASPDPDNGRTVVDQRCDIVSDELPPFPQAQTYELSLLDPVAGAPAELFVALSDDVMTAGYRLGDPSQQRWVSIAEGAAPDYEGLPIYMAGRGSDGPTGSPDDDTNESTWWIDIGPRPATAQLEAVTAEVSYRCESTAPTTQTCTYSGDDQGLLPDTENFETAIIPADFGPTTVGPNSVLGSDFVTSISDDRSSVTAGIVTQGTHIRSAGVHVGSGEFEGFLIHIVGWAELEDPGSEASAIDGVLQLTALPIDPAVAGAGDSAGNAGADPEGEVLPPVEPAEPPTQGAFEPTCSTGNATEDPANSRLVVEQDCTIAGVDSQPFAADQVIELSLLEAAGTPDSPAGAFLALGDSEFMQAGLLWDAGTRGSWVGVAEGEGDYAGEPVWLSGDSKQNADGTLDTTEEFDGRWWTTDGPRPSTSDDASTPDDGVLTAEVTVTCENIQVEGEFIPFDQTCTYESDDPRFVPEPESGRFVQTPADFATTAIGTGAVMGNDYFTATLGDTTIRAGLLEGGQFVRWVGMRVGTGEFEGLLIQERAWAEVVQGETPGESTGIGVIQMTVLPAEG